MMTTNVCTQKGPRDRMRQVMRASIPLRLLLILFLFASCNDANEFLNEHSKSRSQSSGSQSSVSQAVVEHCTENLRECLASPLSKKRGNYPSESICTLCNNICRNQRSWPRQTHNGRSCEWWKAK